MRKSIRNVILSMGVLLLLTFPVLISGKTYKAVKYSSVSPVINVTVLAPNSVAFADKIYDSLDLEESGLSEQAFELAWKGYQNMLNRGLLAKKEILSICDFSQSSKNKRLYVIDLIGMKLLINTYVAHGKNSGTEFATSFSNSPESHKSSLGFYVTKSTYLGEHGLSLKIDGVERGFNDKALKRNIVVHGSEYVGPSFLKANSFSGRSFGCPAIPDDESDQVINSIKDGSCLFIYYPSKAYISRSQLLKA